MGEIFRTSSGIEDNNNYSSHYFPPPSPSPHIFAPLGTLRRSIQHPPPPSAATSADWATSRPSASATSTWSADGGRGGVVLVLALRLNIWKIETSLALVKPFERTPHFIHCRTGIALTAQSTLTYRRQLKDVPKGLFVHPKKVVL